MMSEQEVRQRLTKIVAEQLSVKVEELHDESTLDQLGADSLDRVEIIMKIEDTFHIEVNDDDAEHLTTLGALVAYVMALLQSKVQ